MHSYLIVILLAVGHAPNARPVPAWSIQTLQKEADLVLFCAPSKVEHLPALTETLIPEQERPYFTIVRTTFYVTGVLKGQHLEEKFSLDHYALTEEGLRLGNGPVVADFANSVIDEKSDAGDAFSKSNFIIYLKKTARGYEFVTGQDDSAFSVKSVQRVPGAEVARYDEEVPDEPSD